MPQITFKTDREEFSCSREEGDGPGYAMNFGFAIAKGLNAIDYSAPVFALANAIAHANEDEKRSFEPYESVSNLGTEHLGKAVEKANRKMLRAVREYIVAYTDWSSKQDDLKSALRDPPHGSA